MLLLVLFFLALYFRLYSYFDFESLKQHRQWLLAWKSQHFLLASLIFVLTYIVIVAISIPGATLLTLTGGFLFGLFFGTLYVVFGATIGAVILFLSVKSALAGSMKKIPGRFIAQMKKGFLENAWSYLMTLRLIPLFPFWMVNIVSALLDVRIVTFVITTFFGIIPGTFVYVWVGTGLGYIFDTNQQADLSIIFSPNILLPLLALAVLSLTPVIYKKIRWKSDDSAKKN